MALIVVQSVTHYLQTHNYHTGLCKMPIPPDHIMELMMDAVMHVRYPTWNPEELRGSGSRLLRIEIREELSVAMAVLHQELSRD